MRTETILWRRLDAPGHDACRLVQRHDGWRLHGVANFRHDGGPASLTYQVDCDDQWVTLAGAVWGWVGAQSFNLRITRSSDGVWTLNRRVVPDLDECFDLDLGFTPATNLFPLRRVALQVGQAADVAAAWIDVPAGILAELHQRYERRHVEAYWYQSQFGYSGLLQVNATGFVTKYPRLWQAEP